MKFNEYIADKNQTAFAKSLGVSQTIVSAWVRGEKRISAERVLEICMIADWQVAPHELRPDIYPNQDDGLPPAHRSSHHGYTDRRSNDRRHGPVVIASPVEGTPNVK
jgi:DNA-binding transcriptional regulator YdaS (Cro superfamily)